VGSRDKSSCIAVASKQDLLLSWQLRTAKHRHDFYLAAFFEFGLFDGSVLYHQPRRLLPPSLKECTTLELVLHRSFG